MVWKSSVTRSARRRSGRRNSRRCAPTRCRWSRRAASAAKPTSSETRAPRHHAGRDVAAERVGAERIARSCPGQSAGRADHRQRVSRIELGRREGERRSRQQSRPARSPPGAARVRAKRRREIGGMRASAITAPGCADRAARTAGQPSDFRPMTSSEPQHQHAEHHREIAADHAVEQQAPDARPAENRLDDDAAPEHGAELHAEQRDRSAAARCASYARATTAARDRPLARAVRTKSSRATSSIDARITRA